MKNRTAQGEGHSKLYTRRTVIAWALYDWANSAFATSIMVGFFPLFLNLYWSVDASGAQTTTRLMTVNGLASLVLAIAAPLLGAIADRGGWRKRLLLIFATGGAVATASLYWVPHGSWLWAVSVFGIASVGFAGANVFYDAMLIDVVSQKQFDTTSALGYAAGYVGGGVLLAVHLLMVSYPDSFGLADSTSAVRVVFLTVAIWWLVFSLPLAFLVRERKSASRRSLRNAFAEGLLQLRKTFRRIGQLRNVIVFLIAYWLYIDAVNTVMKVAIDFGYKLGIDQTDLLLALLIVQFISFPAALFFGWLGERIGPKRGLLIGLSAYIFVASWATFMQSAWEFYFLACTVGMVQGGVASLSRSYYARLIPPDESAEFFGFYNMIGKFAAVLGPLLVAAAAAITGSTRTAVLAVLPLLLGGFALLAMLPRTDDTSG